MNAPPLSFKLRPAQWQNDCILLEPERKRNHMEANSRVIAEQGNRRMWMIRNNLSIHGVDGG